MPVGPLGPSPGPVMPQPGLSGVASSALSGLQNAQATVAAASEQVAAGNTDPAVIVDVVNAETSFAVNATVLKTGDEMTRKLLDVLA